MSDSKPFISAYIGAQVSKLAVEVTFDPRYGRSPDGRLGLRMVNSDESDLLDYATAALPRQSIILSGTAQELLQFADKIASGVRARQAESEKR